MKTQIAAKVGRVVGEIAKEREAARIEVCEPLVEPVWKGPQRDPSPGFILPLKVWHDSGSLLINLTDLAEVDGLIDQLQGVRADGEKQLAEFAAQVRSRREEAA